MERDHSHATAAKRPPRMALRRYGSGQFTSVERRLVRGVTEPRLGTVTVTSRCATSRLSVMIHEPVNAECEPEPLAKRAHAAARSESMRLWA